MTCDKCKGLGSMVKANPITGEFEILECSCQRVTKLLNNFFRDESRQLTYEIRHVEPGYFITIEHHNNGKKYKRQLNQMLFEADMHNDILQLITYDRNCFKCETPTWDRILTPPGKRICDKCWLSP